MSNLFSGLCGKIVVPALALLLLLGFAYRQAPSNVFHLDDYDNIVENPAIHVEILTPGSLWNAVENALLPTRPLANLSFAFDWWRGGGDPRPFQWTNLTLHTATSLCLFAFLFMVLRLAGCRGGVCIGAALFGAMAWASHPIQVQAVTYIVQRMTMMATLFTLLTVIFFVLGRRSRSGRGQIGYFALAASSFIFGLASKQNAAIAPGLVLLAEYGVLRHGQALVRGKGDLILLVLPVVVLVYATIDIATGAGPLAQWILPGYEHREFTLIERLLTQPRVVAFHLSQIFWPLPGRFSLEHDFSVSTGFLTPPSTAVAIAAVVLWCGAGVWALLRPRWRVVGFFMLWLPASLAIESTAVPLEMIFEHRMYLPSMGLAGLVALGVARLCGTLFTARLPLASACFLAVILLAIATSARIPVWSDRLALAEESLARAPGSARAWAAVGKLLAFESRWDEAEVAARRALELNGDERFALDVLVVRLMDKGDLDEADRLMSRRMTLGGIDDHVLNSLGELRLKQGRASEAARYFRRGMAADMAVPAYRWNLALALERAGECRQAREQWLAYIELEKVEADVRAVREHLRKNYQSQGGTCTAEDR